MDDLQYEQCFVNNYYTIKSQTSKNAVKHGDHESTFEHSFH